MFSNRFFDDPFFNRDPWNDDYDDQYNQGLQDPFFSPFYNPWHRLYTQNQRGRRSRQGQQGMRQGQGQGQGQRQQLKQDTSTSSDFKSPTTGSGSTSNRQLSERKQDTSGQVVPSSNNGGLLGRDWDEWWLQPFGTSGSMTLWPGTMQPMDIKLNVGESADKRNYEINAHLPPGVNKNDVHINVDEDQGLLSFYVEKRNDKEDRDENKGFHSVQRSFSSMKRSIPLPDDTDYQHIVAKHNTDGNNILLTVPKTNWTPQDQKSKRIHIH